MNLKIEELQNLESEMLKEISIICYEKNIPYFIAYGTGIAAVRHKGPIPWDGDADIVVPYSYLEKFISAARESLSDKYFLDYHDINPYYTATFPRVGLKGYSTVTLHLDVFIVCGLPNEKEEQAKFFNKCYKLRKKNYYKVVNKKYRGRRSIKQNILNFIYKVIYIPFSLKKIREDFYSMCNKYTYEESNYITNPSGGYGSKEIIPRSFLGEGKKLVYSGFTVNAPEQIDLYLKHFYGEYMSYPPEVEREVKDFYHIHKLKIN